jgi:hypothetical protein
MIWIMHIAAVVFFIPALFITIPIHLLMHSGKKK